MHACYGSPGNGELYAELDLGLLKNICSQAFLEVQNHLCQYSICFRGFSYPKKKGNTLIYPKAGVKAKEKSDRYIIHLGCLSAV